MCSRFGIGDERADGRCVDVSESERKASAYTVIECIVNESNVEVEEEWKRIVVGELEYLDVDFVNAYVEGAFAQPGIRTQDRSSLVDKNCLKARS